MLAQWMRRQRGQPRSSAPWRWRLTRSATSSRTSSPSRSSRTSRQLLNCLEQTRRTKMQRSLEPRAEELLKLQSFRAQSSLPRPSRTWRQPGKRLRQSQDRQTQLQPTALARLAIWLFLLVGLLGTTWPKQAPLHRGGRHQLQGKPGFTMLYFNTTLFGRKAMSFLAELDPESKPDAIAFVEVHLRGTDLNATRRRVRKLG